MKIHETLNNDYNLEIRYKIIKYFSDEDFKKLLQLKNWRSITGLLEKMYDNFSLQDSANYTYKFMRLRENNWTNFDERLFLNALRAFKRPRKIKIIVKNDKIFEKLFINNTEKIVLLKEPKWIQREWSHGILFLDHSFNWIRVDYVNKKIYHNTKLILEF